MGNKLLCTERPMIYLVYDRRRCCNVCLCYVVNYYQYYSWGIAPGEAGGGKKMEDRFIVKHRMEWGSPFHALQWLIPFLIPFHVLKWAYRQQWHLNERALYNYLLPVIIPQFRHSQCPSYAVKPVFQNCGGGCLFMGQFWILDVIPHFPLVVLYSRFI